MVARLADGTPYIASTGLDGADFIERWEARKLTDAENTTLREMFEQDIEAVTIAPAPKRGSKVDPSQVKITWR